MNVKGVQSKVKIFVKLNMCKDDNSCEIENMCTVENECEHYFCMRLTFEKQNMASIIALDVYLTENVCTSCA